MGRDQSGHSITDDLGRVQRDIILNAANESPCVIIGRGADYILRDIDDVLSVFIHADDESRQKRIMLRHHKSEQEALELLLCLDGQAVAEGCNDSLPDFTHSLRPAV